MDKKSFFIGFAIGCVLTFAVLVVIGLVNQNSSDNDPVKYLEHPVSYEGKTETSCEVLQVFDHAALAREASDKIDNDVLYLGNTVLILGKDFYSDQIITIKNPQRVGTYSYTTQAGIPMTVPVITGAIK